jgi:hypothetical protein
MACALTLLVVDGAVDLSTSFVIHVCGSEGNAGRVNDKGGAQVHGAIDDHVS